MPFSTDRARFLVTGGCGFIGSNFIRHVLHGWPGCHVLNLDKLTYAGNPLNLADVASDPRYRFVRGDICDLELVDALFTEQSPDAVVHFAADSHVDRSIMGPQPFVQTNLMGTFSLLEVARRHWLAGEEGPGDADECRFIHVSTDEVYGTLGETGFFTESTPYDPRSPYSASKAGADHLVNAYFHTYGLPAIVTNCSNNYGPYQFPEKLIPVVITNALRGTDVPVYGDGQHVRDWIYVGDHCGALMRVLERGRPGQTYNIGGSAPMPNIEVVRTICDRIDALADPLPSGRPRRSLIRMVADRPGHDRRYALDISKIEGELRWRPTVSFDEGIDRTVRWYLDNREWCEGVMDGAYRDYYESNYGER